MTTKINFNMRQYKEIALKHCPTVYDEINEYVPNYPNNSVFSKKDIDECLRYRPAAFDTFYCLSKKVQRETSQIFFQNENIKKYLDVKHAIETHNRDCFIRLWELYTGHKKEYEIFDVDETAKNAIKSKMDIFRRAIMNTENPFPHLRLDFQKYEYGNLQPQPQSQPQDQAEYQKTLDLFSDFDDWDE